MDIGFVLEADEIGQGRVVVDGRYYGLPIKAVLDYKRLRDDERYENDASATNEEGYLRLGD